MKHVKKIVAAGLAVCTMAAMAACNGETSENQGSQTTSAGQGLNAADKQVDSLTIAIGNDENTMAPFTYISGTGTIVNRLIYDTLLTTDLENNIIPWMVEDNYEVDAKSQVFTFTLKEGQKFHNGRPLTAEDVKFSFEYPADQNVAAYRKISNAIDKIEVLDAKTIRFTLKEPDINFLRDGFAQMRIICKDYYDGVADGTTVKESVGSGMYKLVEYKTGQYYKLEAVDDYFRGTPQVKNINMPIMKDNTAIQQGLLSGELDSSTTTVGVEVVDTIKAAKGLDIFANPGYAPEIFNMNNGEAPFNNVKFREAISYSIDVNTITETLYGEYATVGTKGAVRSDLPYAEPGLEYTYDTKKAEAILDELGYDQKNGDGIRLDENGKPLNFEILCYSSSTSRVRAAEMIAANLKQVGIQMDVKTMEMDTVDAYVWPDFEVSKGRDYDTAMWGWSSAITPTYLVSLCSSDFVTGGYNVCGYKSEAFDKLVNEKLDKVTTMEEMESLLRELQQVVAKENPLITLAYPDKLQVCNTERYGGWKVGKGANVVNIFTFLPDTAQENV